jgi:hypothetical protein
VFFVEVPAAGADEQRGDVIVELVLLAVGVAEADGAPDGVDEVELALDHVFPGGRVGVFEVGHEDVGAGIEGVDHHLAVGGAGDLYPALLEIGGNGRYLPLRFANVTGAVQESGQFSGVDGCLAFLAFLEQQLSLRAERSL